MEISELLSDDIILTELGERVARARIELQLTQARAAEQAGVSKRTFERVESGASVQMASFIRVLRALKLLARVENLLPESRARPMDLLRDKKSKARQRVSGRRGDKDAVTPWVWDEDH